VHHADGIGDDLLSSAMKTAQDLDSFGHRLGSEKAGAEDAFPQASDFAVLVNLAKMAANEACNLQTN